MIFGYARVSTKTQARDGNSLDAQQAALTAAGKDTFPWERLVQPSLPVEAGRRGREGRYDPRKHEGRY